MKVKELISKLEQMPQDMEIAVVKPAGGAYVTEYHDLSDPWVGPGDVRIQVAQADKNSDTEIKTNEQI